MNRPFDTYTEDIYAIFKEIDVASYHDIINFYQRNQGSFSQLSTDEYFEVFFVYSNALFETARYRAYTDVTAVLLEMIIFHNIKYINQEDIFESVLFKKAAAHYHLFELDKAEKILWELLKINPSNSVAAYLLRKCKTKQQPTFVRWAQGTSIILFMLAATTIALELLLVKPFFEDFSQLIETLRNCIFISGVVLLIVAEGGHRLLSFHRVNRAIEAIKSKKIAGLPLD